MSADVWTLRGVFILIRGAVVDFFLINSLYLSYMWLELGLYSKSRGVTLRLDEEIVDFPICGMLKKFTVSSFTPCGAHVSISPWSCTWMSSVDVTEENNSWKILFIQFLFRDEASTIQQPVKSGTPSSHPPFFSLFFFYLFAGCSCLSQLLSGRWWGENNSDEWENKKSSQRRRA